MKKSSLLSTTLIGAALVGLFCFSGCSRSSKKGSVEQKLRVNFAQDPPTMDPRKGGDLISSTMHFMLFEGLTRMTPDSTTAPGVAEKIEVSKDAKTYTFYLRDSQWANGDPVTAYDFAATWTEMLNPTFPCPNANLLYPIKNGEKVKKGELSPEKLGITVLDEKTLQVELETETPYFLELTSFCVFSPTHHKIVKQHPDWADSLSSDFIGNGPFKMKKWRRGDEIILEKNPLYWDAENVQLEEVQISLVESDMTAFQMYQNGELDLFGTAFSTIPSESIPNLSAKGIIKKQPMAATTFCSFNTQRFPFHNVNLRKAFSYALNRTAIIDNITQSGETVATGCIPPILKGGENPQFFEDNNLSLAKEHFALAMDELEISPQRLNGLTLKYCNTGTHHQIAQALQQQWKRAFGIDVYLEGSDFKVFLDTLAKRDFDLGQFNWIAQYNDQMNILDRFKFLDNPKNYCGWYNEEYAALLEHSSKTQDPEVRGSLLGQAEKIFVKHMPVSCLYHWNNIYLEKDYVKGFYISPIGSIHLNGVYIDRKG